MKRVTSRRYYCVIHSSADEYDFSLFSSDFLLRVYLYYRISYYSMLLAPTLIWRAEISRAKAKENYSTFRERSTLKARGCRFACRDRARSPCSETLYAFSRETNVLTTVNQRLQFEIVDREGILLGRAASESSLQHRLACTLSTIFSCFSVRIPPRYLSVGRLCNQGHRIVGRNLRVMICLFYRAHFI